MRLCFGRPQRRILFVAFPLIALIPMNASAQEPSETNPHHLAHACLDQWSATCGEVCSVCHLPEAPSASTLLTDPSEGGGDAVICSPCHSDKAETSRGGAFLLNGHGGSHPVGVPYQPGVSSADLVYDPQGPKLICKRDKTECLVGCSTCHNPMGDAPSLLRVSNSGSALCLSCHQKESGDRNGGLAVAPAGGPRGIEFPTPQLGIQLDLFHGG